MLKFDLWILVILMSVSFYSRADEGASSAENAAALARSVQPSAPTAAPDSAAPPVTAAMAASATQVADDTVDEGYTDEVSALKAKIDALFAEKESLIPVGATFTKSEAALENLKSALFYYNSLHGSCVKTQAAASTVCREKTSPDLQKTLNEVNMVLSMVAGAALNDACSSMAKAFRLAQVGMTAYTVACSAARATCDTACSTVNTNLLRLKKLSLLAFNCDPPPPMAAPALVGGCINLEMKARALEGAYQGLITKDSTATDPKSIAAKTKACKYTYTNMILSAGLGITQMIRSMQQSKKCDDQTNGTPTETDVCKDPLKAKTEECLCKVPTSLECVCFKNPRTAGCSNEYQKAGDNFSAGAGNLNSSTGSGKNSSGGSSGGPSGPNLSDNGNEFKSSSSDGGAGGVGAPTGGGGAGLGGGGGGAGGGSGKSADGDATRKLNTNILGGAGGGGGGGWGFSSGDGSSSDKYRAYLPGGAKDPSRGVAGQQSWTKEVTGQGGKSNWEKVRDRYQDNKNSLLNN